MDDFENLQNENIGEELQQTVRRLAGQVRALQESLAEREERDAARRRRPAHNEDDGEDDSENNGTRNTRHGIRADSLKIFKFDGTDFHLWEFSMSRYLKILKLWQYVIGEAPKPEEGEALEVILGGG